MINNQRGQAITEAVLIMVLLFGITFAVSRYFKEQEVLKQLIQGPFLITSGLLQNGIWAPAKRGAIAHPNSDSRHRSLRGESGL